MIAWIIGIIFLLIISILISNDETVESFVSPTVVPTKIRPDLTCSDPESSAIFDRYDKSGMESLGSDLEIPPNLQNAALTDTTSLAMNLPFNLISRKDKWLESCQGGTLVFIQKYKKYNFSWRGITYNFNFVDLYCCKGEMIQPPETVGEDKKICLPLCPSNYTKSSSDETICIRNDNNCTYTADLSANIQNNWSKTCASLYRQNANILSTINSISSVVSTFSKHTSTIQSNYTQLYDKVSRYTNEDYKKANYNNNFGNITNGYNSLYSMQGNISDRYNTLQGDKIKFDTLFNNLGCSNYM